MSCPTTETLERLALGFLDDPAPAQSHVAACAACKDRLETLTREHGVLVQAAKAVPLPKVAKPRTATRGLWRLGLAAACVLGTVVVATVFTSTAERPTSPMAPPVARTEPLWNDSSKEMSKTPTGPPVATPEEVGARWKAKEERRKSEEMLRTLDESRARMAAKPSEPAPAPPAEYRYLTVETKKPKPELAAIRPPALKPEPLKVVPARPVVPEPPKPAPPPEAPDAVTFKDPGINPVVDTSKETQSTFALDVDTASYTVMRTYLTRGALPPKESVRVEEYLNYFRYQDPHPPEGTFAVRLEAAPSPFDADRHLLRVAIQARETRKKNRKDFVLTLVIDVSGSMAQNGRLELVKESIQFLADQLRPSDRVGIIVFSSAARKILDMTAGDRKDEILRAIEPLRPEQSTNAEDALRQGYDMASKAFDPKATNRVLLFSDGVANTGLTRAEDILNRIREDAKKGIWLTTIGVGMGNLNDALLEKLANSGNGNYAYVDDLPEAKKVFGEKLLGTMEVVAIDAKVQLEFEPATVATFRLLGYENRHVANKDFRNDKVDAGEVGSGHHVTALYEVSLKPGGEGRLATARVRYREPGTDEMIETHDALGRSQVLESAAKASASYRLAAAVAQFAEILRENPRVKAVTCAKILEQARPATADLDRPEDAVEFLKLVEKAAALGK